MDELTPNESWFRVFGLRTLGGFSATGGGQQRAIMKVEVFGPLAIGQKPMLSLRIVDLDRIQHQRSARSED